MNGFLWDPIITRARLTRRKKSKISNLHIALHDVGKRQQPILQEKSTFERVLLVLNPMASKVHAAGGPHLSNAVSERGIVAIQNGSINRSPFCKLVYSLDLERSEGN